MSKQIKIGQAQDNDVVISNPRVSRYHAILYKDDAGQSFIIDLESTNGTQINGNRIMTPKARHRINPGDIIKIANELIDWRAILDRGIVKPNVTTAAPVVPSLNGGYLITRDLEGEKHLVQRHPKVSRLHAKIYRNENGSIIIEDLGSRNGTFVNGNRITSKSLKKNDKVTLTEEQLHFEWEEYFQGNSPWNLTPIWKNLIIAASVIGVAIAGYFVYNSSFTKDNNSKQEEMAMTPKANNLAAITVDDQRKAVFKIETRLKSDGRLLGTGTGFFIDENGTAVTNYHVLYPEINPTRNSDLNTIINRYKDRNIDLFSHKIILYPNGEEYQISNKIKSDQKNDYVIITTNPINKVSYLAFETDEPNVGEDIIVIGNSGMGGSISIQNNVSFAHVTSESVATDDINDQLEKLQNPNIKNFNDVFPVGSYFIFDGSLAGGNSGGPIINKRTNKVIGIATAAFTQEGFNIGIKTNKLDYIIQNK